jgi:hypothetical protein
MVVSSADVPQSHSGPHSGVLTCDTMLFWIAAVP